MTSTARRALAAPLTALAAGLVVGAVGGVQDGGRGALSALLGTALVVGFLASGLVPLLLVRGQQQISGALGAGVLLLNYSLRLAVAALVLRAAARSEAVIPIWTGSAIIASALAWAAGQALVVFRDAPDPAGQPRNGGL